MSNKKNQESKKATQLEDVSKDLDRNVLKEDEKGQIEGGFSSASLDKDIQEPGTNIWCNENC
uniref:Uncharacterized protein n=1 Tax=Sphingobacterium sp. (strain 21) TaxID=743722 RepID=F4C9X8_SPHS2